MPTTIDLKQSGAQSATFFVDTNDIGVTNALLDSATWALLPKGKLKDLLTQEFFPSGVGPNYALRGRNFYTAAAEAGLRVTLASIAGEGEPRTGFYWATDEAGFPILAIFGIPAVDDSTYVVVSIGVSYSASE
jgi:hypothetical protein